MDEVIPEDVAKRSNSLASRDIAHLIHGYTNLDAHLQKGPLVIERGKGIYVYDEDGKEYIEGMAGLWCAGLGFGEEELAQAAVEQMRKLPYYHGFTHKSTPTSILLAEKLKQIAPADFSKVFFVNSGSEANDTQIKLVWYYNNAIGRPQKKKIISRIRGYHGVTVASASLTGLPMLHTDFDLPIAGILHTATPHHYREAWPGETEEEFASRLAGMLEAMIVQEGPDTVAAFIAEPIMGAGGVIVPPATYFPKIQAVCTKYDVLFIADEVICGFGRTGNVWGSQTFGIKPDLLSCAKQLSASYLPIAACLINEDVYQAMLDESRKVGTFGHGYTYSGHPVPAAVALKALELYETRGIYDNVNKVSPRFAERIAKMGDHPLVGNTRSVGLIGAIELVADKPSKTSFHASQAVGPKMQSLAETHGAIIRVIGGDHVAFCPPMIITESEIDELFDRVEKALDDTEAWVAKEGMRADARAA